MKWKVDLEVADGPGRHAHGAQRSYTVESKSVSMALEKAIQQARHHGLQIMAVCACNPLTDRHPARF